MGADSSYDKATLARVLRLETMVDLRKVCDEAEAIVPEDKWTLATYKELLFLDSHPLGDSPPMTVPRIKKKIIKPSNPPPMATATPIKKRAFKQRSTPTTRVSRASEDIAEGEW